MSAATVAELVEVPLAVPFDDFLREHNSVFLPVLLRQPGIISVKTGRKLDNPSGPSAVSLTLWRSLEDHERFTTSVQAGPFFEGLARFTTGPPTIGHYRFGLSSDAYAKIPYTEFRTYKLKAAGASHPDSLVSWSVKGGGLNAVSACLEGGHLVAVALFGQSAKDVRERKVMPQGDGALHGTFTVEWASFGTAKGTNPVL